MVLGGGAAHQDARGKRGAQAVDGVARRGGRGVAARDGLHQGQPLAAGLPWADAGDARIPGGERRGPAHGAGGTHELQGPRGAGAEGGLHLVVALARGVGGRDDLDRGHPGPKAEHRDGQDEEGDRAGAP